MSVVKVFLDVPISAKIPWGPLYVGVEGATSWIPTEELVKVWVIQIMPIFKVAQNSFQHFPRRRFWCVIMTTFFQLMLQSWYQKTAQLLVIILLLFS